MRYITRFKLSESTSLYTEMTYTTFVSELRNEDHSPSDKILDFTKYEADFIKNYFSTLREDNGTKKGCLQLINRDTLVEVYKKEDDYFYILALNSSHPFVEMFFKCDQFDGLKSCLEKEFDVINEILK